MQAAEFVGYAVNVNREVNMNRNELWGATLLTAYKYLPEVAQSVDRCIYATALSGFDYAGSTMSLYEKMMSLNAHKENLINAKVITDICLGKLCDRDRKVLEGKYFRRMTYAALAAQLGVCLRTVFRYHDTAISAFASAMESEGYDADWLESRFRNDAFIGKVILRVEKQPKESAGVAACGKCRDRINSAAITRKMESRDAAQNTASG